MPLAAAAEVKLSRSRMIDKAVEADGLYRFLHGYSWVLIPLSSVDMLA